MSKSHLLIVALLGGLFGWIFAPALVGDQSFAFRDAAHFYHPLFEYAQGEWGAARVPLWNPYENGGIPLAAGATASVFYPGKLLFALPLDYTLLYNVYVVAHVALAALAAFCLARHLRASVPAAGLAALAYAFSGNVLFQSANVVFLVGAAWLPLALLLADRTLSEGSWRAAVGLGAILALMTTGGDPQMAYNAGLLAALLAILRRGSRPTEAVSDQAGSRRRGALALLAISAGTCLALAAIQMLPAWQATRQSERAAYESPRNLLELASSMASGRADPDESPSPWYSGLLGTEADGHQRAIYQFSIGPWRAIEFVWPNIAGRQFPTHRRWLEALPAEGRVWTPSLYMGLLPLGLAIASWSVRRSAPLEVRWLSWTVLLSAVASFGVYGLAWMTREVAAWFGGSAAGTAGDEVGGLYLLMVVVLPGYVYFRYPAKLLVVTALGLSMLSARGWDHAWQDATARLRNLLVGMLVASLAGLVLVAVCWPMWSARLEAMPPDPVFGPFDAQGAWRDVMGGLGQSAVISFVLLVLMSRSVRTAGGYLVAMAPLALTAIDLGVAQPWFVAFAPAELWRSEPSIVNNLGGESREFRIYRDPPWQPAKWRETSSPERLSEVVRWDRETLLPKYPLPYRLSLVEASSTMTPFDYRVLLEVARKHGAPGVFGRQPHPAVLDLLGARTAIGPRDASGEMAVVRRATALPRAWIVHEVEVLPTMRGRSPTRVKRRTEEVLFPGGRPRDWRAMAVVESDEPLPAMSGNAAGEESCRVVSVHPERIELEVQLSRAGLVVLSDAYDAGWSLTVETDGVSRSVPILRTNRVMRGTVLPAGRHRLVYRYRPASVIAGAVISGLSLIGLAWLAVPWRRATASRFPGRAGG